MEMELTEPDNLPESGRRYGEKISKVWSLDDWKNGDFINRHLEVKNRNRFTVVMEKMMSSFFTCCV